MTKILLALVVEKQSILFMNVSVVINIFFINASKVTINDNGLPPLSSTTRVVITVGDENDEEPQFLDRQYRVRVPRLSSAAQQDVGLFRVVAFDKDIGPNADIDYSLTVKDGKGTIRFSIHPKTGMIYALKDLDKDAQYDLQVGDEYKNSQHKYRY